MSTYSDQSLILTAGLASSAQIDAFMADQGHKLAAGYAPDGQYQPPPVGLGQAIVDECARYSADGHVVNHDQIGSQISHETAGWQSRYARERNNPGGIGATNDNPDGALWFDTPQEGVRAHVAHMLTYCVGYGPWTADDPRADAIDDAGWTGVVDVLRDLDGKWAYPGQGYGAGIAAGANVLLDTTPVSSNGGTIAAPPLDRSYPSPNRDGYSSARVVEAVVWHISEGSLASNLSWLTNPDSGASCNYLVSRAGDIYELVPPTSSAWCNGKVNQPDLGEPLIAGWVAAGVNPNTRTLSIEHEGYTSYGAGGSLTVPQTDATVWLTAWLCQEWNIPTARSAIFGHYQIDSVNRPYCSGFSAAEWESMVAAVAAYGGTPAPGPDDVTGKWIAAEFRTFYDANGGVDVLGRPVSGAFLDQTGRLVQYCERYVMEYWPEHAGTAYEVQGQLLGTYAIALRYPSGAPASTWQYAAEAPPPPVLTVPSQAPQPAMLSASPTQHYDEYGADG